MSKELVLRLTKDDFHFDYFRAGGKGGSGQNKRSTGVRCRHLPSGAVGEGRDQRSQPQNKKNAWLRCIGSVDFRKWLKVQTSRSLAVLAEIDDNVARLMEPENIVTQVKDNRGKWVDVDEETLQRSVVFDERV